MPHHHNMKKVLLLFVMLPFLVSAQQTMPGGWAMFFGNIPLKNKSWELFVDAQLRDQAIGQHHDQVMLRAGITHKWTRNFSSTAGFANILFYQEELPLSAPRAIENRYWMQLFFNQALAKGKWDVRYRFEYRDLEGAVPFRSRLRLHAWQPLPSKINVQNKLRVHVYDELFVNTSVENWHYDRNRLYAAVGYQMAPSWEVQLGYLAQNVRANGTTGYLQVGVFFH
jgi:hypothetical protein